ncbi:unnamed protein product [Soboliphyme baturini]|uniref:AbiTii domain-containing protein n=1 Tax=Soboliphyme baturini TaxID=241478 RepID=A0A183IAL4_9BILA|nr:unnamed protein product [Soboliphyme baturini]
MSLRDGGLGIPDLNELVARTKYNILSRTETTDDPLVAALALTPYVQKEIRKCEDMIRKARNFHQEFMAPYQGEQCPRLSDRNLKPDLIINRKDGTRVLIDVTVPFDGGGSLRKAADEKMRKYGQVANEIGGGNLEVWQFVIGERGSWWSNNSKIKNLLKITGREIRSLLLNTIRASIVMVHRFGKTVN